MMMSDFYRNDPFERLFFDLPLYQGRDRRRTGRKSYVSQRSRWMRTDVRECKDGYVLMMELPGFQKEEIIELIARELGEEESDHASA